MPETRVEDDFREFVSARSSALLRTAYLLAGDWATAEDLLQISLTKTFLAWKRLGHIEAVEPYARRVLVNTATSWWRRRWHGERPTEVLPESVTADGLDERLERDALWRHVRALPARQRAVLVLRFYEDQSEADTARLLGVSVGTVKSQSSRALATLRQRLGEQGIEPAVRLKPAVQIKSSARPASTAQPATLKQASILPAPRAAADGSAVDVEVELIGQLDPAAAPASGLSSASAPVSGNLPPSGDSPASADAPASVEMVALAEVAAFNEVVKECDRVDARSVPCDGVLASAEQRQGS